MVLIHGKYNMDCWFLDSFYSKDPDQYLNLNAYPGSSSEQGNNSVTKNQFVLFPNFFSDGAFF